MSTPWLWHCSPGEEMYGKTFAFVCLTLVMFLAALPLSSHAADAAERQDTAATIKIGLDIPLTGSAAAIGHYLLWGVRVAVDETNAAGGVLGRPVELLVLDDETSPDKAAQNIREFVDKDKVAVVLGPANSGNALAFIPFLQERRVPNMLLTASATTLTKIYENEDRNYIFRATLPDAEQLKALARWAAKKFKKIAIASDSTPYGQLAKKDFFEALATHGLAPVETVEFELGALDMTSQALRLKPLGIEALAVLSLGPEIANMIRSADAIGLRPVFIGLYPFFLPSIAQLPTRLSDGLVGVLSASPEDSPKAAEIDRIVRRDYLKEGYYPFKFVVAAYEGTKLSLQAIANAGSTDGTEVRDALENTVRFEGVHRVFIKPFSKTDHELYEVDDLYLGAWKNGKVLRLDE